MLPYIEAQKNEEAEENQTVKTPDIRNMTINEAEETLKQSGLDIQIDIEEGVEVDKKQTMVVEQLPKPGIMVKQGTKIIISI